MVITPMMYTLMFCGLVWSAVHTSRELKSLHTRGYGVWSRILAITEHVYCIADRFRSLVLTLEMHGGVFQSTRTSLILSLLFPLAETVCSVQQPRFSLSV